MGTTRAKRLYAKALRYERRCMRHERAEDRLMIKAAKHAAKAQHYYDVAGRYDDLSRDGR